MSTIAIIPARGGSKGLPGKNIKLLAGKPMIAWTIEQAKASKYLDEVIVSTDDEEIARVAKEYGACVPFLRPAELARDDSLAIDAVIHLLKEKDKAEGRMPDLAVVLQATTPLMITADIDGAIEMLASQSNADAVVSITEVPGSPYWFKVLTDEGFIKPYSPNVEICRLRQDDPAVYRPNGAIYVGKTKVWIESRSFYPENTLGYVMPQTRSIDIDTARDFELVELMFSNAAKRTSVSDQLRSTSYEIS